MILTIDQRLAAMESALGIAETGGALLDRLDRIDRALGYPVDSDNPMEWILRVERAQEAIRDRRDDVSARWSAWILSARARPIRHSF